jgi:hypothetical protein
MQRTGLALLSGLTTFPGNGLLSFDAAGALQACRTAEGSYLWGLGCTAEGRLLGMGACPAGLPQWQPQELPVVEAPACTVEPATFALADSALSVTTPTLSATQPQAVATVDRGALLVELPQRRCRPDPRRPGPWPALAHIWRGPSPRRSLHAST